MLIKYVLAFSLLGVFLVQAISCSTSEPQKKVEKGVPGLSQKVEAPSWQTEWDKVVRGARKEGKLVVYSTGSGGRNLQEILTGDFRKKFGIDSYFTIGRGGEVSQKLLTERRAGLFIPDIYFGGAGTPINVLKPAGVLESLEGILLLPEVVDPAVWYNKTLPFVDKEKRFLIHSQASPQIGMAINNTVARPEDFRSYLALLEPKWKGKIVMNDPTTSGGKGQGWFSSTLELMGLEFMKSLARQDPAIIRDQRLQVEWLARGKFAVATAPEDGLLKEFTSAGSPITIIWPKEGTNLAAGSGNIALVKDAPHPNAARLLINWFLSREGQRLHVEGTGGLVQSSREDLPIELTHPDNRRMPGMHYVLRITEEGQLKDDEDGKFAREIFGPLVK